MKKLSDIIGLRIVTIEDGLEIGIVRSVILNPEKGKIDYFATEKGISLLKAKIMDFANVEGIGDYALTIKNKNDVFDINSVPEAMVLLQEGVEVVGNKVITKKGKLIGEAVDLTVDEDNACIVYSVQILSNNLESKIYNVSSDKVVTYGKTFLVIDDECCIEDSLEKQYSIKNVSDLFEFKQKQFLKGKKCSKTIISDGGEIIVEEGQVIDDKIYDFVKEKGRIFELVKNFA
jgi:sporulation protein YlmC with PRC-barrel domain